jgi:NADH-quinone oxidoreductase subunit F
MLHIKQQNGMRTVFVCRGTGCVSNGSTKVYEELQRQVAETGVKNVVVDFTGCHGFCQRGPIVDISPEDIFYTEVKPEDIADIVNIHFKNGQVVERLLYRHPVTGEAITYSRDVPFYSRQTRLILRNCGRINPERIDDYLAVGGYEALNKVLTRMTPEQVIDEVKRSGLRGRGGAGFPVGTKWELCRKSPGTEKYMICNADEGDPGAFMDRSVLEADPHSVLEGMEIAAYAIGAGHGYIYVRAEYPLAVSRFGIAVKEAKERGFLGRNILGSNFNFDISIVQGAGAFVCGEETALIASIEGRRGMPRPRPPFPAQSGLWGKPSNINNVKSLASVPLIITKGADWYAGIGVKSSPGTAVFALTGKVANQGLVEVPMGIRLWDLIYEIGGGISRGKRFKAVQTGGPSGGCLPASFLGSPVDYETLTKAGSIMGSGGMVVLDEDTCIVDLAKYFLTFTQAESCGKCVPCRVGTRQMLSVLTRITNGQGRVGDIELLEKLASTVKNGSLCGLGQTAPNPVLTTLKYFREEYEEHIKKHHCRAAVCKGLVEAPCSHTCPAGIDVPRYIRFIEQGEFGESCATIREKVPFPGVLGRVCFHPCESRCRRGQLEQPVAIKELKRLAADFDSGVWKKRLTPTKPTGKRVAVVGSGPAGLTAAYYLARLGHEVSVFEALPHAGGMMRVGIPEYRLPRKVLNGEIDDILSMGVTIKTNTKVASLDALKADGFQAVFVAVGAHRGQKIGISGEESSGVMEGVEFLRRISLGEKVVVGERVAVIGGGNVAIDAARTALRLGAKDVLILYRRTEAEMPAAPEEIEGARQEGVKIVFLVAPHRIEKRDGKLVLEMLRMTLGDKVDARGRRQPVAVDGSQFSEEFDTVIAAIGQVPDVPADFGLASGEGGVIKADPDTLATSKPGVFSGGDCVSGPASVIEAIAAGRQAAVSIDRFLGGKGNIEEKLAREETITPPEIEEGEAYRPKMRHVSMTRRCASFAEVDIGLTRRAGVKETKRCLRCDLEPREE